VSPLIGGDDETLDRLRDLVPGRPLNWSEARSLAERQAALLLKLAYIDEPPILQFVIGSLPSIVVERRAGWPTSGMAVQGEHHWRIVLCADDPVRRQRFSLAHEFKHVLDDPVIEHMHAHIKPERREARAERLCDYFAACLLMPRAWIKRDWAAGVQDARELANRYYVSRSAMETRLHDIGLQCRTESSLMEAADCEGGEKT
jgi:predicted transcriptional regulator